jgi:hypothetical protein
MLSRSVSIPRSLRSEGLGAHTIEFQRLSIEGQIVTIGLNANYPFQCFAALSDHVFIDRRGDTF